MAQRTFESSEQKTIVTTTYQVVSLYGAILILVAAYLAGTQLSIFPPMQAVLVFIGTPLAIPMVLHRKSIYGAYASLAAQAILVFSTTFSDEFSDARVSASSTIFLMSYLGIVIFSPRTQYLWIGFSALLWVWIVPGVPLYSNAFGDNLNFRWVTLVQLLVSGFMLRYVWNFESDRMQQRANQSAKNEQDLSNSIAERQRLQSWRSSLVRIHETVLNDIRSVLDAKAIDGPQVLKQLKLSDGSSPPPSTKLSLKGTFAAFENQLSEYETIEFEQIPNVNLDHEISEHLKNVLVELSRNRFRHSKAKNLRVKAAKNGKWLVVRLVDDGEIGFPADSDLGLGRGVIIRESLENLQAELSETSGVKVLKIPLPAEEMTNPVLPPFSGRAVLSSSMAGNAIGGSLAFLLLIFSGQSSDTVIGWLGLTISIMSIWVAFNRKVPKLFLIYAGLAAGVAPLYALESAQMASCSEVELSLIGATLSSIAVSSLVVWADRKVWWLTALPSALSMSYLAFNVVGSCETSINPPLLASLISPMLIGVVAYALRETAMREAQDRALALSQIKQIAETDALEQFTLRLHNFVQEARTLMTNIAKAEKITRKQRTQLMAVDGAIRATIQVDPSSAGAFALAAELVVLKAAEVGIPTRVLVLKDSGDKRELPDFVREKIEKMVFAAAGTASIQILSNTAQDSLTVLATKLDENLDWDDAWLINFEDGSISFNRGQKREPHILILKRKVRN